MQISFEKDFVSLSSERGPLGERDEWLVFFLFSFSMKFLAEDRPYSCIIANFACMSKN